jgi:hypothetical protein
MPLVEVTCLIPGIVLMKEFAKEELKKEVFGKDSSRPFDGDDKNEDNEDADEEKELPLVAGNAIDSRFFTLTG